MNHHSYGGASARWRIPIPETVLAAIAFLQAVLLLLPPRVVDLRHALRASTRRPIVVWSDAMWNDAVWDECTDTPAVGGLGFVVWFPPGHPLGGADGRFSYASRWVGLEDLAFLDRVHSLIGQLELVAAAAVYVSYPQGTFDRWDVIHFVDNSSALYGLVKGYSGRPDSLSIIRAFHAANLAMQANVWPGHGGPARRAHAGKRRDRRLRPF